MNPLANVLLPELRQCDPADGLSYVQGRACYAVYQVNQYKIGFEMAWGDKDMLWQQGLPKQIGYCKVKPGAAFEPAHYHFDADDMRAIEAAINARDKYLFEESATGRDMRNLPSPQKYQAALELMDRERRRERMDDPQIWIPEEM